MPNTPNYQGYSIPTYDNIMSNLSEGQNLLGSYTSGEGAANFFGFGDEYNKYFNPVNMEGIQEGLSQIPELQKFLHGQARSSYSQNRDSLLGQVGKTNLAGTGSFQGQQDQINTDFSNKMFSADKQVQSLVQQYQNQLNTEVGDLYGTAKALLAGGAESDGGFGTPGFGDPNYSQGDTRGPITGYSTYGVPIYGEDPQQSGPGGGGGSGGGGYSDRRIKENIHLVDKSPSGIKIYEFEYKDKARYGDGKYRGVIAQEVPEASYTDSEGVLYVDYDKIDVNFERIERGV